MPVTPDPPVLLATAAECLRGDRPWRRGLLVDVGSTFTKVCVVGPDGTLLAAARDHTTIDSDVLVGVTGALALLPAAAGGPFDWALTSSSAAGGLRMVSVGLTASLSGRAGEMAALGAGGKLIDVLNGYLADSDVERIKDCAPHVILLTGGTNGGNTAAMTHNASRLALVRNVSYVLAGSAQGSEQAAGILRGAGADVRVADNVFPAPGALEISSVRDAVIDVFMTHITKAKGLDHLLSVLDAPCEPTPVAASRVLDSWRRTGDDSAVLVDVGGATTDVHSSGGRQHLGNGGARLPLPEVQRTVEADLGMRWGAEGVVHTMAEDTLTRLRTELGVDLRKSARLRAEQPEFIPDSPVERLADREIARRAVGVAVDRHVGHLVIRRRPWGERHRLDGKDLRNAGLLLVTGGVFQHASDPARLVAEALAGDAGSGMVPRDPQICVDDRYAAFAVGLIAPYSEQLARALFGHLFPQIRRKSLEEK
ncbi:glutamate mutase L [Mycolicibacterium sp.]|uniref:glutamate mutase L n=1 Tax=Mycolicibacterium sp. TaxID=2320850 RepID=UPI003D0C757E